MVYITPNIRRNRLLGNNYTLSKLSGISGFRLNALLRYHNSIPNDVNEYDEWCGLAKTDFLTVSAN